MRETVPAPVQYWRNLERRTRVRLRQWSIARADAGSRESPTVGPCRRASLSGSTSTVGIRNMAFVGGSGPSVWLVSGQERERWPERQSPAGSDASRQALLPCTVLVLCTVRERAQEEEESMQALRIGKMLYGKLRQRRREVAMASPSSNDDGQSTTKRRQ